jgi:hypothetical protein
MHAAVPVLQLASIANYNAALEFLGLCNFFAGFCLYGALAYL